MNKSKRGGLRNPSGGRPALPPELKRRRCGFMTLPTWLIDWLAEQYEPAGHIIEAALMERYNLEPPK